MGAFLLSFSELSLFSTGASIALPLCVFPVSRSPASPEMKRLSLLGCALKKQGACRRNKDRIAGGRNPSRRKALKKDLNPRGHSWANLGVMNVQKSDGETIDPRTARHGHEKIINGKIHLPVSASSCWDLYLILYSAIFV